MWIGSIYDKYLLYILLRLRLAPQPEQRSGELVQEAAMTKSHWTQQIKAACDELSDLLLQNSHSNANRIQDVVKLLKDLHHKPKPVGKRSAAKEVLRMRTSLMTRTKSKTTTIKNMTARMKSNTTTHGQEHGEDGEKGTQRLL
ncbi:hypothetical protein BGZ65_001461 [Modicella reniformis]|uniref:Uncharacterized protein n=1 Tax=Modicella reniformis TaxID=1440133 RepID=A0A9P6SQ93_9FUNG|nr:hypothetical protein BGZ65_001461 [Modicella reniformis]